jgi:glycosyltransferase involved in cell wall biosynthesis
VQDGGAERVALEMARMFPAAEMHTSFFDAERFGGRLAPARVNEWPLQRLVGPSDSFRSLLPLYPAYFTVLRPPARRLVITSSSAFAHGVRHDPGATHIAYVHSPMRFAWESGAYLGSSSLSGPARAAGRLMGPWLRTWDRLAARRADVIVANSAATRARIRRYWRRDAVVIHPPVDVDELNVGEPDEGYLLIAARLLGYRRIELAIEAAAMTGRELVVAGDGPERRRLEEAARAARANVRFAGHLARPDLVRLIERCHALLLPGIEDFGIVAVEAMAAGRPVVAFGAGGALETVIDGTTGVLFSEQTAEAMADAIARLDSLQVDAHSLRQHARRFDTAAFHDAWRSLLNERGLGDLLAAGPERR